MKLTNVKNLGIFLMLLTLFSCANERPVYQGAEYYKNLEVPPDLTEPDTGDQLRVPDASEEALQRFRDNNKLETVVTPKFDGVRVVNYAGNSWIEVDNDADHVWLRLEEFWHTEGVELVQKRPLLGFMETEWTNSLGADAGFFRSMFQKFEPDQKDKFRVRLERFDDGLRTRLYISHARIERGVRGEYGEDIYWRTLPSDLEAEREIISRMALFAGISQDDTLQLLENYRPYASLVKLDRTNTIALTMTGSMDFVWRRAMRALDRMRMQDIREEDELAESSWLMQLLTGSGDEDIASGANRQYRLEFSDVDGRIQIEVKDAKDSLATDDDGDVYSTALAEQLRNLLAEKLE